MKTDKKYYFLPLGNCTAMDIWAANEKEARAAIRAILGKKTLHNVQLWRA